MEPHLYLKRGKKDILLVRYFDKFHFIELNHQMHHQARKWLLACPRTEEEMGRWHISRSTIAVKYVRGVAAGGTGRGQVVQFYLTEGKRRYELAKDCDLADMSALFSGLESFTPPKQESNWQDPRLAKQDPKLRKLLWPVGWVLNAVSCISGFLLWAAGFEIPWLCWLCLLCIPASTVLYCLYPDYYCLVSEKRKYGQKKGVSQLWGPVACPAFMLVGAMLNYALVGWWKAWIYGAVAVVILAVVLYYAAPVFRSGDKMFAVILLGLLFSGGPVLMLNNLMDSSPARVIQTEVVDKYKHTSRKSPDRYDVTVIMDGKETEIPVDAAFYSETEIGDLVTVELHDGALGIAYASIYQIE